MIFSAEVLQKTFICGGEKIICYRYARRAIKMSFATWCIFQSTNLFFCPNTSIRIQAKNNAPKKKLNATHATTSNYLHTCRLRMQCCWRSSTSNSTGCVFVVKMSGKRVCFFSCVHVSVMIVKLNRFRSTFESKKTLIWWHFVCN